MGKLIGILAGVLLLSGVAYAGVPDLYSDGRLGSHGVFMCHFQNNQYVSVNVPLDLVDDYLAMGAFKQEGDCPIVPTQLPNTGAGHQRQI